MKTLPYGYRYYCRILSVFVNISCENEKDFLAQQLCGKPYVWGMLKR